VFERENRRRDALLPDPDSDYMAFVDYTRKWSAMRDVSLMVPQKCRKKYHELIIPFAFCDYTRDMT